jgi:hypothetical protein
LSVNDLASFRPLKVTSLAELARPLRRGANHELCHLECVMISRSRSCSPLAFLLAAAVLVSGGATGTSEETATRLPRVVLVLDKSGSMEGERYERLSDAVTAALAILPDSTEVAVVVFDHQAKVLAQTAKLTAKGRQELVKAVASVRPEGGTDILAGIEAAVNLLTPKGGIVLLLSDGLQTGSTGSTPWPREKWEPPAKALSAQARKYAVVTHTIALGPDAAADALLKELARSTGGQHWKISKPDELLARYVEIAAQMSSFWLRSEGGEFFLPAEEVVIQVLDKNAPATLFKREGGRLSPASAAASFAGNRVRAERFLLPAGEYSFKPDKEGSTTLLRPMKVRWQLPAEVKLPAGRNVKVSPQAVARPEEAAALKGLVLSATFGESISALKVAADDKGSFPFAFSTPKKLQPLSVVFEATQAGWRFPVGPWSAELVLPPPVKVSLRPEKPLPLSFVTSGTERSAQIEIGADTDTPAVPVVITFSSSIPGLDIEPGKVKLDRSKKLTVSLTRAGPAAPPRRTAGSLNVAISSADLVPPRLNDAATLTWDFRWTHLTPRLELRGLTEQDYTVRRGGTVFLPVDVTGMDLGSKEPRVLLEKAECPKGVRLGLAIRDGEKTVSVPSLPVGPRGAVEVTVDGGTPPGAYRLILWVRSNDGTPLNGATSLSRLELSVFVPAIDVELRLQEGRAPWVVVAPVGDAQREVVLEAVSRDGQVLPDLDVDATQPAPLQVTPLGRTSLAPDRRQYRFALLVPGQSRPFQCEVRFAILDGRVGPGSAATLSVVVPPVRVRATPVVTAATRYPPWAEFLLRHVRPTPECSLRVVFDGAGVEEASCSWALVDEWGLGGEPRAPGEDGLVRFESVAGHVRLESRYAHTEFLPGARIPITHEVTEVPVPPWVWSIPVVLLAVGYFAFFAPLPVEARSGDQVVRKLRRVRLGPLAGLPALRLELRRGWFGRKVLRLKRDQSTCTVVVRSAAAGEVLLLAGMVCAVRPGDKIEVSSAGATRELVVGPSGAKAEGTAGNGNFFDDLGTGTGPAAFLLPDEWLRS